MFFKCCWPVRFKLGNEGVGVGGSNVPVLPIHL